jgi:outer membrane protein
VIRSRAVVLATSVLLVTAAAWAQPPARPIAVSASSLAATVEPSRAAAPLDLEACLALAAKNGTRRKVADASAEIALARQGQALSSRYPEVSASLTGSRLDEDPNFVFPSSAITVPAFAMQTPAMVMTLPANAFGPGFPPVNVPLPVPGSTINVPAQVYTVPEQDVKLMDRNLLTGSFKAFYALYTGGLAGARIAQARAGVAVAREEQRKTDLEVAYDVKRAYYGVVLARQIVRVAKDALARMEGTLELTESLYKNGSGRVKKTDYLRNKAMVDTLRSMVAEAEGQERAARAGLETAVEWTGPGDLEVADKEIVVRDAAPVTVAAALEQAYASSPDIGRVQAGVKAARAGVDAAFAGHLPKVGAFANLTLLGNSYNAGMVTSRNKQMWTVGFGVEVPVFQGFRVAHEVGEARAELKKLEQQQTLLREGIALDVRRACSRLDQALAQRKATRDALDAAAENRDLNTRAYQEELVETKDVIEAQLMEALLEAQHDKVLFDCVEARATLDFVVGQAAARR